MLVLLSIWLNFWLALFYRVLFMLYFFSKVVDNLDSSRIVYRKNRPLVSGFKNVFFISPGDILELFFAKRGSMYMFEGLCLAIRKNFLQDPNTSLVLRNFIYNVGVECIFSYYYNRVYLLRINDFKRKFGFQRKSKLYFLRESLHLQTQV
jgi:ribosomal protein L19